MQSIVKWKRKGGKKINMLDDSLERNLLLTVGERNAIVIGTQLGLNLKHLWSSQKLSGTGKGLDWESL